jgi:Mrp family chromosome partitioning ATPase
MNEHLDVGVALRVIRRRAWLVVVSALVALGAAHLVTGAQQRRYEATATLFIDANPAVASAMAPDTTATSIQLATLAQSMSTAYAALAQTRAVAVEAANRVGMPLSRVIGHVRAEGQPGVQLVRVHADATTSAAAARVANAAAQALADRASGLKGARAAHLRLDLVDPAQPPATPATPRPLLNLALGALLGLALGLGLATARERIDRRIRSASDAEASLGLPILGELPRLPRRSRRLSALDRQSIRRIADPYRALASSLMVATENGSHQRVLITSPGAQEGKSTTAAHLALALVQDGESVALFECDLHRPSLHRAFPETVRRPIAEVLAATNGVLSPSTQVLQGLKVVAPVPEDVNGLVSVRSAEFIQSLDVAGGEHGRVLLDCPPILSSSDTGALARRSDAAILVLAAGRTREEDAISATAALTRLGVPVLGVVLTGTRPSRRHTYYGELR